MKLQTLAIACMALAASAAPAAAHHSFAMFDAEKSATIEGTVKQFQWTNPHAWILLVVRDAEGSPVQWAIELGGTNGLVRQGFVPKSLTPGMEVKVMIHPLRNGSPGGQFLAVTLPDGKVLGNPDREPGQNIGE